MQSSNRPLEKKSSIMVDTAASCNFCGLQYTLPDGEDVGKLPHVLRCGHIFCAECLRSLESPQASSSSISSVSCPECTISTEVGEEGVGGLPVDSRIIGLIYTAKMNSKRSTRGGDKQKGRRLKSPPTPPLTNQRQSVEEGSDIKKVLDDALCKATENLKALDSLHRTLVTGMQAQLKKEKARLIKEIEDCFEKANSILQRRRSALLAELGCLEELFSSGREVCRKLEERRLELCMAIQKARHVHQVPLLETYCHLDEIMQTLLTAVDAELYDKSCLTLRTDLSCSLDVDGLTESMRNYFKMTDGSNKLACEEAVVVQPTADQLPKQPVSGGGSEVKKRSRGSPCFHASPLPSHRNISSILTPNVIVEEILEETESGAERDTVAQESLQPEKQKIQRRTRKPLLDKPPVCHPRVLQEWVLVTHVINPTHFYVRYVTEHKGGLLLSRKISSICSGERSYFNSRDQVRTDVVVFARWNDVWCRALVCELFQKGCLECVTQCSASDVARVRVFFQDYGFSKGFTISGDGLRGLNECVRKADITAQADLHRWAPQAIKCSLKDIIPSDLIKGWSKEASDELKRVIGTNVVEMQVLGEEKDVLLVDLKKASEDNTMNDTSLSLREHLVFMELARFYSPQVTHTGSRPLQFYPPVQPKLNTKLNAVVSHVNTPSDFYIQLVDNMEFLLLNTNLQNCYGHPGDFCESELQIYSPVLSQACVALYDNKDWCRAQVTDFSGGQMVEIQYVDFGNRERLSVKDLRQIKEEFFALPAMAVRCSLADVLSVGEPWSNESIRLFRELTEQKLVTVVAKKLVPHFKAIPVCLYNISEHSSELLTSIGEIMLKKGLASSSKQTPLKEQPKVESAVWDPPLEEVKESPSEPVAPTVEYLEQQLNLTLTPCLKDVRVRITHVTSPGNICVQLLKFDPQLKRVHDLLKREFSKSELQEVDWKADMFCAANVNGVWERGKLCSVSSSNVAEVLRCDFGSTVKLHFSNLRPLPADLGGSLLLECCLSDIRPAGGCLTWTATACDFISYYLKGATAIMTIKDPSSVRPVPVSLFCSNRAGRDVSIADFLISEGLALRERTSRLAPAPKPASPSAAEVGLKSGETLFQKEKEHEESTHLNERASTSYRCPPKPAPRITPPPERVKTQAYLPPELPPCGHIHMNISSISEDGVIYGKTPQAECEFERLQECLKQHIKTLPREKHYNWKSVLGCAVMGSDMLWYRGQVQEVIGGHVKVRYVDQGIVENIPVCHVYPMVLCENVPQLCVPCQINGVLPVGAAWQWDAVALMKELLLGRLVNVQIMELPEDPRGLVTVEIMLDGMPLSRIMVHHQHATFDPTTSSSEEYVVKPPVPDLDDWDFNTEGLEEPHIILGVYTDLKLPGQGKEFWVRITHIRTPNEVFLSFADSSMCDEESLEKTLEQVNMDIDSFPLLTDFPIEGPCLAEYSDGKYYRAKLLGFSELNPSVQLLVRHVDFGSDDIVPPYKLRCLPPSLLRFPCLSIYVQLAGFRPPQLCEEKERVPYRPEWSMKAMTEMIDLLHGKLRAVVTAPEPKLTVVLYKIDGTLVHSPLVKKGLAEYE